jgi:acetyl-CoA carboxylase biotin carboxylase subunit
MRRALQEYEIGGIKTTLSFFREVMEDEEFIEGRLDTSFISRFNERRNPAEADERIIDIAAIAAALAFSCSKSTIPETNGRPQESHWGRAGREMQLSGRL